MAFFPSERPARVRVVHGGGWASRLVGASRAFSSALGVGDCVVQPELLERGTHAGGRSATNRAALKESDDTPVVANRDDAYLANLVGAERQLLGVGHARKVRLP